MCMLDVVMALGLGVEFAVRDRGSMDCGRATWLRSEGQC